MKIYTLNNSYEIGEGIAKEDRRGKKWESLNIEGNKVPIGTETVNRIGEEELEQILRKEGLI